MLIGNDLQVSVNEIKQLSVAQQMIRIAGPVIYFIAEREGFVQEHPARGECPQQVTEQWPVKIISDVHLLELTPGQRPGRTRFQIGLNDFCTNAVNICN